MLEHTGATLAPRYKLSTLTNVPTCPNCAIRPWILLVLTGNHPLAKKSPQPTTRTRPYPACQQSQRQTPPLAPTASRQHLRCCLLTETENYATLPHCLPSHAHQHGHHGRVWTARCRVIGIFLVPRAPLGADGEPANADDWAGMPAQMWGA